MGHHDHTLLYHHSPDGVVPPYRMVLSNVGLGQARRVRTLIEVEFPDQIADEPLLSLHLAGNPPAPDVENLARQQGRQAIHIRNCYGNEPEEEMWRPIVQEVVSLLDELRARGARHLHLCLDVRLAMSYALGIALGNQRPITIYHFNPRAAGTATDPKHQAVFALPDLVRG